MGYYEHRYDIIQNHFFIVNEHSVRKLSREFSGENALWVPKVGVTGRVFERAGSFFSMFYGRFLASFRHGSFVSNLRIEFPKIKDKAHVLLFVRLDLFSSFF